eukprot:gene17152-23462_t
MSTVKGPENGAVGGKQVLLMLLPLVLIGSTCEASPVRGLRQSLKLKNLQSLWGTPGAFAGVNPWDVSNGLNESTIYSLYDPAALERARGDLCGRMVFNDNKSACTFMGLVWRMVFNDNEAACAFMAAGQIDNKCAMAHLGAALTMGPNVNYAFIANAEVYRLILESLKKARVALNSKVYRLILESLKKAPEALNSKAKQLPLAPVYRLILESLKKAREALNSKAKQLPLAPAIYTALKYRYCVNEPGQLNHMLSLTAEMSFAVYQNSSVECETGYQNQTLMLADKYQEDPNVAVLATGALMEQPAWKWWQVGSVVAGALLNINIKRFTGITYKWHEAMIKFEMVASASLSLPQRVPNHLLTSTFRLALWWLVGSVVAGALLNITINDNTTAGRSPMGQLSELMEAEAAISNLIMQRGMNTQPEHLGLLHYMIHNMEANPNPALALNVAEKLYNLGGSTQGHAAHMRTHIDMRVGDYANALDKNKGIGLMAEKLDNLGGSALAHGAHMRTHIDMRVGDYANALDKNKGIGLLAEKLDNLGGSAHSHGAHMRLHIDMRVGDYANALDKNKGIGLLAEKLCAVGGSNQGHAAHMRMHIDMCVGDYANALDKNKVAVWDDALWNLARSGGGIMSVLYKYNPHNIAFIAEAAQHAGNWKELASSISNLNYGAGFPLAADPTQLGLDQFLMHKLTV